MAQDNPFLSFFESMGTGMEAGAERRSLMQRAERGQLKASLKLEKKFQVWAELF
jgi:hypothetical protein